AVAQNRCAADHRRSDQLIFEGLDDELFFAHQAIDGEPEFTAASADHDHENSIAALACGIPFQSIEAHKRQNLFAQLKHFVIVDAVDALLGDARDFRDGCERHGVESAV